MKMDNDKPLITTVDDRCKMCFTCVRDCPAKAIRVSNGQAQVIADRCIGCGNCVRVCSQNAKQYYRSDEDLSRLLAGEGKTAAILAPSFPAEFTDIPYRKLVAMLRRLEFDMVCEVAFGADIVAAEYKDLVEKNPDRRFIATTCPAIVAYVEKYHPSMVRNLAPIASPMIAMTRALRELHGTDLQVVFIGPCIAKKAEGFGRSRDGRPEIDAALTFRELREIFSVAGIEPDTAAVSEFDPPNPGLGALFALSGGMLQAAGMEIDLLSSKIVAADGKNNFVEAIKEFEDGALDVRLLEVLCCNGCIRGSGMSNEIPYFTRLDAVSRYVRERIRMFDAWEREDLCRELRGKMDISVDFLVNDHRLPLPSKEELDTILECLGKLRPEDELDCGACGYSTCREHAIAIHKGLAESEMCLPSTIDRLKQSLADLNTSNSQLEQTRQALFNAEKLASMGQLSAGIAHEINNPLGVILLNAGLLLDELDPESEKHEDLRMIVEQAERCKKIVSGLLNFARKNKVILQPASIRTLVDDCLKTIMYGDGIEITVEDDLANAQVDLDRDQMTQVLTNLLTNAIEAMPDGGDIRIRLYDGKEEVTMEVADSGCGIPKDIRHKIFEPLFTTKQMGKGTGLGLAVTYGIVKMHRGRIEVDSNDNPDTGETGTSFKVILPRHGEDSILNINQL